MPTPITTPVTDNTKEPLATEGEGLWNTANRD